MTRVVEILKRLVFTTSAAGVAEVVKRLVFTTSASGVAEIVKRLLFPTSAVGVVGTPTSAPHARPLFFRIFFPVAHLEPHELRGSLYYMGKLRKVFELSFV